jgi:hypothetical protein
MDLKDRIFLSGQRFLLLGENEENIAPGIELFAFAKSSYLAIVQNLCILFGSLSSREGLYFVVVCKLYAYEDNVAWLRHFPKPRSSSYPTIFSFSPAESYG